MGMETKVNTPGKGGPKILTIVPARYRSSRFPGKIIAPLEGKPVVAHTYAQACKSAMGGDVVVAADAPEIVEALKPYDIPVVMTRVDHPSGTDRIAEVAATSDADIIVNVQGDEPLLPPQVIDEAVQPLLDDPEVVMTTARHLISDPAQITNPNVVKVICDTRGRALYFSRAPIPYIRDEADQAAAATCYWLHVGLYVYRRDFLLEYAKMPMTPLEKLEKLEQLRALENGYAIAVVDTEYEGIGVDTREDLAQVAAIMAGMREGK